MLLPERFHPYCEDAFGLCDHQRVEVSCSKLADLVSTLGRMGDKMRLLVPLIPNRGRPYSEYSKTVSVTD